MTYICTISMIANHTLVYGQHSNVDIQDIFHVNEYWEEWVREERKSGVILSTPAPTTDCTHRCLVLKVLFHYSRSPWQSWQLLTYPTVVCPCLQKMLLQSYFIYLLHSQPEEYLWHFVHYQQPVSVYFIHWDNQFSEFTRRFEYLSIWKCLLTLFTICWHID